MAVRSKSIVPKVGEPDIDESYIRQQDVVVLETLLIDWTMTALNGGSPVNIKWAVDDYLKEYPDRAGYGCEDQIALDAISSSNGKKSCKVKVEQIKLNQTSMDLTVDDEELSYDFITVKGCSHTPTYRSTDEEVVSVDEAGNVEAEAH